MTACLVDPDTLSTLFVMAFLLIAAALALWAGQRSAAENLSETHIDIVRWN